MFFVLFSAALGLPCSGCKQAFSSCGEQRLLSSSSAKAFHCGGFSCCRPWALGTHASAVIAHRLSCPKACGILVPRPGIKPVSLALGRYILFFFLVGIFLITGLPGKFPETGSFKLRHNLFL